MRQIGLRALDALRFEKGYGIWSREYAQSYTPAMCGLDRYIAYDKAAFVGRDAALRERESGPATRLVLLKVDATDADANGFEPVWSGGRRVGFVTSGGYGHTVRMSLALAYVERPALEAGAPLSVQVVGEERTARVLPEPPYDPHGLRLRGGA